MLPKAQYKTQQRQELLHYLESAKGSHVTAADVCGHLQRSGKTIGMTTVYRQLERMVDEGLVNKYVIDGASPACFEFVDPRAHVGEAVCFHCKCDRCGTLIHLHCEELEAIGTHLKEDHGFRLNPMRTVFYGLCARCAETEETHGGTK